MPQDGTWDMVIAECPLCGARRYSWCEEDAREKLSEHRCTTTLLDKELREILKRAIEGAEA